MTTPAYFWTIYIYPNSKSDSFFIPNDLFNQHTFSYIYILEYQYPTYRIPKPLLKIHPQAFQSTRDITKGIIIRQSDLGNMSFSFLEGFKELEILSIWDCYNCRFLNLPTLPKLSKLFIIDCKGMNEEIEFPLPKSNHYNIDTLCLPQNLLNDEAVGRILDWILSSQPHDTLRTLTLSENRMTRIPHQLKSFGNLEWIYLNHQMDNTGFGILSDQDFSNTHHISEIYLKSSNITRIKAGFFNGICFHHLKNVIDIYSA